MKPKIIFLTKYSDLGASSRLRTLQYLNNFNFDFRVYSLFYNDYIKALYENKSKLFIILYCYISRIFILFKNKVNLVYIEKELFPYLPYFLGYFFLKNKDYILDFDDAIFHNYDNHNSKLVRYIFKNKIPQLIKNASLVIVGNEYLKNYALKNEAKRVEIIPTSVDIKKYNHKNSKNDIFTIGWIGSPSTISYLSLIHDALKKVSKVYDFKLKLIGISNYIIEGVDIECFKWSFENETKLLSEIDLGIMPLPDNFFERGKCGYKLIQYGASNKPSIASPIGINNKIIKHGFNGFLAKTNNDWARYITILINDTEMCNKLGLNARERVENEFTIQKNYKKLEKLIKSV